MTALSGLSAEAAVLGGIAASTATYSGWYNRDNFMFDVGLRFERFVASRGYMNTQVGQYREDIRNLTDMVASKMDTMYAVGTLFMAVGAACSTAGRIGMFGAAPPHYILALYTGHICTSVLYLTCAMWFALHGSQRAQCAMVSLLTRKLRFPIPSIEEIDQARVFGSAYEKQKWADIFRVPFTPHPHSAPREPKDNRVDPGEDGFGKSDAFKSTKRWTVPSWIRDEQIQDKGLGGAEWTGKGIRDPDEAPDHFKLFANAQLEWYPYEIYARVCMLYGALQFFDAMLYFSIGHAICELREFWVGWSIPMLFICAKALILRLDILKAEGQQFAPNLEWAGYVAPYLSVIALTIDYQGTYSAQNVKAANAFAFLSLIGHMLFQVRLLDIAWPRKHRENDMPDEPGKSWWPSTWHVPTAFMTNLWILAPPAKLEPGQHDMLHEAQALSRTGGGVSENCKKRKGNLDKAKTVAVPINVLQRQSDAIDASLDWWYEEGVYSQVPEPQQKKLDELKFESERIKREIKKLDPSKKNDSKSQKLSQALCEVEDGVQEISQICHIERDGGGVGGGDGAYTHHSPFGDLLTIHAADLPWRLTRLAILTVGATWGFVILGIGVEVAIAPATILKPPGLPPWIRDTKFRKWTLGTVHHSGSPCPADYRLFAPVQANYEQFKNLPHLAAFHMPILSDEEQAGRRLGSRVVQQRFDEAFNDLVKALPELNWLASELSATSWVLANEAVIVPRAQTAALSQEVPTIWPTVFEPRHIACFASGDDLRVVALTSRGFGALLTRRDLVKIEQSLPFSIDGLIGMGQLVGASWLKGGLHLVTEHGRILRCPEALIPRGGESWACQPLNHSLPVPRGTLLLSAALREDTQGALVVAFSIKGITEVVSMYARSQDHWTPAGQVRVDSELGSRAIAGLAFDSHELLILEETGGIHSKGVNGRSVRQQAPVDAASREWRSICASGLPTGHVFRLALRRSQSGSAFSWTPELTATAQS